MIKLRYKHQFLRYLGNGAKTGLRVLRTPS